MEGPELPFYWESRDWGLVRKLTEGDEGTYYPSAGNDYLGQKNTQWGQTDRGHLKWWSEVNPGMVGLVGWSDMDAANIYAEQFRAAIYDTRNGQDVVGRISVIYDEDSDLWIVEVDFYHDYPEGL